VVTPEGLQGAGAFDLTFQPDYQSATVHHVRVHRRGAVREAGVPQAFQILRREVDLERAIYDGSLTAHMVIPDLRIGDAVETAYSIAGAHPTLGGRFTARQALQWRCPAAETRFSLLAPADRRFAVRAFGAPEYEERVIGGAIERTWRTRDTRPWREEPDEPSWWVGSTGVLVADVMSWAEVADLFRGPYEGACAAGLPADLEEAVAAIEATCATVRERVPAALRLVQSELRYHAISLGAGGFVPRRPPEVWCARFGDCKDASGLLATILRRLGADATPALVNTRLGWDLAAHPPHATAFNHCLVRVVHEGCSYWLDPTEPPQAGRLERLTQARFGWALPLIAGSELAFMGEDEVQTTEEAHETWRFGSGRFDDTELEVRTVHRGWRADWLRGWVRSEGTEGVGRSFREYYEREYGRLTVDAPLLVEDHPGDNELQTTERYRLHDVWTASPDDKTVSFSVADSIIGPQLTTPATPNRQAPIDIGRPRRVRVTRVMTLPVEPERWRDHHDGPGVQGRSLCERLPDGRTRQELELVFHQRLVSAQEAPAYFAFITKMQQCGGFNFQLQVHGGRFGMSRWELARSALIALAVMGGLKLLANWLGAG
jgi:hypothetical protein